MAYKSKKSQTLREGNPEKDSQIYFLQPAGVAELVDARDLKSLGLQRLCGFDSRPPHQAFLLFLWLAAEPLGAP